MMTGLRDRAWLAIDEFVEAFELAWASDIAPDIVEFLPDPDHSQFRDISLELLRVDLELRWQNGCVKTLDEYRAEFPELLQDADAVNQLAFEEFRARRQAGEAVTSLEYAQRFGVSTESWPRVATYPATLASQARSTASDARPEYEHPGGDEFPDVGDELHSFHLQSELGRGAFSRVFLARQGDLANRLVVLKVSAESFAEADKLAQLQHAHIVPIYSVHQVGKNSAVCMPFFGTATLADVVREVHGKHTLPPSGRAIVETLAAASRRTENANVAQSARQSSAKNTIEPHALRPSRTYDGYLKTLSGLTYVEAVLWIGAKLADGLHHAHERGILHQDLKPANVLMADDGRPMLLDFNLSADLKNVGNVSDMLVGGTLPYMAPEQIVAFQKRHPSSDARSDLFSLGVILFELLGGQSPFPSVSGSTDAKLNALLRDRRELKPRLRPLNPAVTPAVEAMVLRCLASDPSQRYQTAAELHEDLDRHLKHLPLRHCPEPSLRERAQKWTRRHARLTSVLSIGMVLSGVTFAVATHQEQQRIEVVRVEVAHLMDAGQQAINDDEAEVAHSRFLAAWRKVQAEPALVDHQVGVAGWLDHSRRATIQKQWKWQVPPKPYDERRDEALVLSVLLDSLPQPTLPAARDAIHAAFDLTIADDPGWLDEREQLTLIEADLIAVEANAEQSLAFLDAAGSFSSRQFHLQRANLLEQAGRKTDAEAARQQAAALPSNILRERFFSGLSNARRRDFAAALHDFEQVLETQPESFVARLLQAICFLQLDRSAEAKVALTSCIAQRPHFAWSYYFRSQASSDSGDFKTARSDLERVLDIGSTALLKEAAESAIKQRQLPIKSDSKS